MKSVFFLLQNLMLLGLAFGLLMVSCVTFQTKAPLSAQISQGRLENGLAYYLMPHHFPKNRCYLRLNVKVGSFHENSNELGIAHLIEHLAFENRVMGTDKELAVWFQEQGMSFGPDANAYTAMDHTLYHMDLPNCEEQSIRDGLKIMHSFLTDIKFDEALVNKQKQIIDREEQDYENSIGKLNKDITHKLFSGTLFDTRPVLGEKKIRDSIGKEKLESFYKNWYRADNSQIILVGDIDPDQIKELISLTFKGLNSDGPKPKPPHAGQPTYDDPVIMAYSPEIKSVETIFLLRPRVLDLNAPELSSLREQLAFDLAIAMLKESITNKSAKQYPDELSPSQIYGFFGLSQLPELSLRVSTAKENQTQAFKRAFAPLKRALDHGFEQDQFERAKTIKLDDIEHAVIEETSTTGSSWAQSIVNHVNGRSIALDAKSIALLSKNTLKNITSKECSHALREAFKNSNKYILTIGELEENQANKENLALLLKEVLSAPSKPLSNKSKANLEFLYPVKNSSVVISAREYFKDIDTHVVTFHNKLRLVLKSTPLQKDVILLQIDSPEGRAVMSAQDLATTELAGATFLTGGLQKHSWQDIVALTQDKTIRLWPRSSLDSLGLNAITRPADLRFSLELIRAFLTEPDFNESALAQAKGQLMVNRQESEHLMSWPLESKFASLLSQNDPRATLAPLSLLEKISREDLLTWFQKWVNNVPLSITAVGDFEVEDLISEIGFVFGSMPTRTLSKTPSIKPLTFLPGIHRTYEVDTKTEASKILIRYPLNVDKKASEDFLLPLCENIILEALRLKLREQKQSIYSPQVFHSSTKNGLMQNTLDILLSADKEKAKRVKEDAQKVVNRLVSRGVTKFQLDLAKKTFLDNAVKQMENLGFWFEIITQNNQNLDKITRPDAIPSLIEKINPKDINSYLKKYFSQKNSSTAIVHNTTKSP